MIGGKPESLRWLQHRDELKNFLEGVLYPYGVWFALLQWHRDLVSQIKHEINEVLPEMERVRDVIELLLPDLRRLAFEDYASMEDGCEYIMEITGSSNICILYRNGNDIKGFELSVDKGECYIQSVTIYSLSSKVMGQKRLFENDIYTFVNKELLPYLEQIGHS